MTSIKDNKAISMERAVSVEPDLSICIVNWNTRELTLQCLQSIYHTRQRARFEVILVDNGSNDGSADVIAEQFPQVRLIRNRDNRGFGSANNQALEVIWGRHCFLLNSDTLIFDDTLDALVRFMDTHPDVAVVTGKIYKTPEADQPIISYGPKIPTPKVLFLNDLVGLSGLRKLFPDSAFVKNSLFTGWNLEQEQEVANVTGACMGVNRKAIDQVGGFDEAFFMYMEETDWCYRFIKAGWRIYYSPTIRIVHLAEGSSRMRTDRDRLYYRSIGYFFRKHYGYSAWLTYQLQEWLFLRWLRYLHRLWHQQRR